MHSPILAPVVALILWSLVMLVWTVASRFRAFSAKGISLAGKRGGRGVNLEGVLPDEVQWKSHNYNHLMEQPTLFYAIALVLALAGAGGGAGLMLGWAYVALRIAHSIVQATVNIITLRFSLFALGSAVLMAMAVRAAMVVF